jgi:hypothetical protein
MSDAWLTQAACAGRSSRWWFASPTWDPTAAMLARTICAGCPVRGPCAADALAYLEGGGDLVGTWGGVYMGDGPATTAAQRRSLIAVSRSIAAPRARARSTGRLEGRGVAGVGGG